MSDEILKVEGLTHTFSNGYKGLDGINFSIRENEFVVIAGRNGSGKTLLMKHLSCLLSSDEGQLYYKGELFTNKPSVVRGRIGLVFQDAESQILGETVYEDISIGPSNLRLSKTEIISRVAAALEWAGLSDKKNNHPLTLSGGEKRRLTIAGMLAMNCEVLIFDEPFANLDYPSIIHVLQSLVRLKNEGKTVIVLTHELEKILAHADRLVIIDSGKIMRTLYIDDEIQLDFETFGLRNPFSKYETIKDLSWIR